MERAGMEAPAARRLFDDFLVVGLVPAKAASPAGSPQLAPKLLYHLIGSDESAVEHTMDFCFPDVENPTNMQISESFTFTLTQGEGTRVFGFCRRLVQDSQLPVCLCVLSQRPWFSLFMHLLDIIQLNYDLGRFVPAFVGAAYEAPLPCGPGKALRIEAPFASCHLLMTDRRVFSSRAYLAHWAFPQRCACLVRS
jgi:hypothetical protein